MNKFKEIGLVAGLALMLIGILIQPVAAWGGITHLAITTELTEVPSQVTNYTKYSIGGAEGPDMFDFLSGKEYYSSLAHTCKTADLPRKMLNLSDTDQKKAYAYGWFSHYASDIKGHTGYINNYQNKHVEVELGVDANIVDKYPDLTLTFYVPYGLVRTAYKNTYPNVQPPGLLTIISATTVQQIVFYIEKELILEGAFDVLKKKYNGFDTAYQASINYSKDAINNPEPLLNCDLNTGVPCEYLTLNAVATRIQVSNKSNKAKHIDPDILDTANKLLRKGVIEVPVQDDKINEVLEVREPVVKNKKAFDDAIAELVKKKKGKQ